MKFIRRSRRRRSVGGRRQSVGGGRRSVDVRSTFGRRQSVGGGRRSVGGRRARRGKAARKARTLAIDGDRRRAFCGARGGGKGGLAPSVAASRADVATFLRREEGEKGEREPAEGQNAVHDEENNATRFHRFVIFVKIVAHFKFF